ncbi:MAG: hypothetical protein M4D80_03815 [Myxococcota bacterium]|nr:hypothetical protein [Myxococcota bacterium]
MKEIVYTVGDTTGSFAKSIGLTSADFAKTLGTGTVNLAKDIGPKRILIGAAILAVAIGGGVVLMRYLRRREEERLEAEGDEHPNTKIGRAARRAQNAAAAMGQH